MSRRNVKKNNNKPSTPQSDNQPRSGVFHSDTPQSSHEPSKARDKVTLKNTRDGLVERNAATGEDVQVSRREDVFDLRSTPPEYESALDLRGQRDAAPDNAHGAEFQSHDTFSQVGKRSPTHSAEPLSHQNHSSKKSQKASRRFQEQQSAAHPETREGGLRHNDTQTSVLKESESSPSLRFDDKQTAQTDNPQTQQSERPADIPATETPVNAQPRAAPSADGGHLFYPTPKAKPPPSKAPQYKQSAENKPVQTVDSPAPQRALVTENAEATGQSTAESAAAPVLNHTKPAKLQESKTDTKLNTDGHGRLQCQRR